jgi:hypothetical protein
MPMAAYMLTVIIMTKSTAIATLTTMSTKTISTVILMPTELFMFTSTITMANMGTEQVMTTIIISTVILMRMEQFIFTSTIIMANMGTEQLTTTSTDIRIHMASR